MKKLEVTNKGAQEVKAVFPQKPPKAGTVKKGGDLRVTPKKKREG
jgi:hypothetical protein